MLAVFNHSPTLFVYQRGREDVLDAVWADIGPLCLPHVGADEYHLFTVPKPHGHPHIF